MVNETALFVSFHVMRQSILMTGELEITYWCFFDFTTIFDLCLIQHQNFFKKKLSVEQNCSTSISNLSDTKF